MFRNERQFVRWLQKVTPRARGRIKLGIGDDAALVAVAADRNLVLTTDLFIEDVHFTRALHPPQSVGHHALARSLSDIAAMGGRPRFALLSLALSERTTRAWIRDFYSAFSALAKRFGVAVVGGDTAVTRGKALIDVILAGEVAPGRALRRSGARPGDQIFVSGRLGLSALGLRLLKSPKHRGRESQSSAEAIRAHLYPEPQCALGRFLSQERIASAAIDVSDGLSTDLSHLCDASGVGAWIGEELIPKPLDSASRREGDWDPLALALHGGEDYQLLFTVPRHKAHKVPRRFRGVSLHWIGGIGASKKLVLFRADGMKQTLHPAGWDQFRRQEN